MASDSRFFGHFSAPTPGDRVTVLSLIAADIELLMGYNQTGQTDINEQSIKFEKKQLVTGGHALLSPTAGVVGDRLLLELMFSVKLALLIPLFSILFQWGQAQC